jgi:hypothetical protein
MNKSPLMFDNVEVAELNAEDKSFTLLVHIHTKPSSMYSSEIQDFVRQRVRRAINYMVKEGFLPEEEIQTEWKVKIGGICHSTN